MAGEIARIPVEAAKRPKRSWDESFFLRFPRLLHLLYRRLTRRGPRSRLRRAVLVQSQLAGWEATNREDWGTIPRSGSTSGRAMSAARAWSR